MPKRLRATSACRSACPASTRRKTKLQASSASDPETLQSQVTKTARKRLSLRGLEVLHGRLNKTLKAPAVAPRGLFVSAIPNLLYHVVASAYPARRQRALAHSTDKHFHVMFA